MSVLDLNGVADPAERKRLLKQAEQETRNAGAWKIIPLVMVAVTASIVFEEFGWPFRLWPKTAFSSHFYKMIICILTLTTGIKAAHYWRRSERKAALIEILRSARRCTGCGYPVDDTPGAMCPECGNIRGCG